MRRASHQSGAPAATEVDVDPRVSTALPPSTRVSSTVHGVHGVNPVVSVVSCDSPRVNGVSDAINATGTRSTDVSFSERTESELAGTVTQSDQSAQGDMAAPTGRGSPSSPPRPPSTATSTERQARAKKRRKTKHIAPSQADTSSSPMEIDPVARSSDQVRQTSCHTTSRPSSRVEPERSSSRASQASQQLRSLRDGSEREDGDEPQPLPSDPPHHPAVSATPVRNRKRTGDQAEFPASPAKKARTPARPAPKRSGGGTLSSSPSKKVSTSSAKRRTLPLPPRQRTSTPRRSGGNRPPPHSRRYLPTPPVSAREKTASVTASTSGKTVELRQAEPQGATASDRVSNWSQVSNPRSRGKDPARKTKNASPPRGRQEIVYLVPKSDHWDTPFQLVTALIDAYPRLRDKVFTKLHRNGQRVIHCTDQDSAAFVDQLRRLDGKPARFQPFIPTNKRRFDIPGFPLDVPLDAIRFDGLEKAERIQKNGRPTMSVLVHVSKTPPAQVLVPNHTPFSIRSYLPEPERCYRCQRWTHHAKHCRERLRCFYCGGEHTGRDCRRAEGDPVTCVNCGGSHPPNYKGCPARHRAIQSAKAKAGGTQVRLPSPESGRRRPTMDDRRRCSPRRFPPAPTRNPWTGSGARPEADQSTSDQTRRDRPSTDTPADRGRGRCSQSPQRGQVRRGNQDRRPDQATPAQSSRRRRRRRRRRRTRRATSDQSQRKAAQQPAKQPAKQPAQQKTPSMPAQHRPQPPSQRKSPRHSSRTAAVAKEAQSNRPTGVPQSVKDKRTPTRQTASPVRGQSQTSNLKPSGSIRVSESSRKEKTPVKVQQTKSPRRHKPSQAPPGAGKLASGKELDSSVAPPRNHTRAGQQSPDVMDVDPPAPDAGRQKKECSRLEDQPVDTMALLADVIVHLAEMTVQLHSALAILTKIPLKQKAVAERKLRQRYPLIGVNRLLQLTQLAPVTRWPNIHILAKDVILQVTPGLVLSQLRFRDYGHFPGISAESFSTCLS